jgi:hypothetical protein
MLKMKHPQLSSTQIPDDPSSIGAIGSLKAHPLERPMAMAPKAPAEVQLEQLDEVPMATTQRKVCVRTGHKD